MEEKDLNRIIVRSLNPLGMAHKISDESQSPKPHDYYGACGDFTIYGESKFLKGYQSFNFNRIESHQIDSLKAASDTAKKMNCPNILSVISLGIWQSRKFFHVYFFDIDLILRLQEHGKNSLLKKELLTLYEQNVYLYVQKDFIDGLEHLPEFVIRSFSHEF